MSSTRTVRVSRGLMAAAFSTFVALFSHVIGGGLMPGSLGIVVPLVLSAFVCVLLAGRRLSLLRLSISVAVSQSLFHTLFVLGAASNVGSSAVASGHAAHVTPVVLDTALMPMGHGGHTDTGMWIAHGVAGIITVAVLHRTEILFATIAAMRDFILARLVPAISAVFASPVSLARIFVLGQVPSLRPLGVYPETTALRGPPTLFVY